MPDRPRKLVIDLFAGAGGASLGMCQGFASIGSDRAVDLAVNHSPAAIACHRANHPETRHLQTDVFDVDPIQATGGAPVAVLWASPDCKHFSRAKGGRPVDRRIRSLAWVVHRWASAVRPEVIFLENVAEFAQWGPLNGSDQPDPARRGETFAQWVGHLRRMGYAVEWRKLRACDYGAPTTRERLFVIARCDGLPIVWPPPTHADPRTGSALPAWLSAASCIDWELPCPSIFLSPTEAKAIGARRPLADNTLRRIANGIRRYVIDAAEPFIVRTGHFSNITGEGSAFRGQSTSRPLGTITAKNDKALIVPHVTTYYGPKSPSDGRCHTVAEPLRTQTTENRFALVAAFLAKHYTGVVGVDLRRPVPTVTARDHNALTAASLIKFRGTSNDGQDAREPMPAVCAGGKHVAEVRAFLLKYYRTATGQRLADPMHTQTTRHRLGLVTVSGVDYQIVDIGMRMLSPRELARAQGFPDEYRLDVGPDGKRLSKAGQVALIGNSVPPPWAAALIRANYVERAERAGVA